MTPKEALLANPRTAFRFNGSLSLVVEWTSDRAVTLTTRVTRIRTSPSSISEAG